ncbi:hypothetical protein ACW9HQ_50095 [Nocardia gipuzkoensis]
MIDARTVKSAIPLVALIAGAAATAWRADTRHLEGFLIGVAAYLALDWVAERLWERATYK